MKMTARALLLSTAVCAATSAAASMRIAAEESILQKDLEDTGLGSHWIYDDVEQAMVRARAKGKPLLVLFR